MYQTNQYEGMLAETVTVQGHKGDIINAYYARPLGPGLTQEWSLFTMRRVGTNGIGNARADMPTTAMRRFRRIYISAMGMEPRRTWERRCARPAGCRMTRSLATWTVRSSFCARNLTLAKKSAYLAPARVVVMVFLPRAG